MQRPGEEQTLIHQQKLLSTAMPTVEDAPIWPPLPRPRPRQGPPRWKKILVGVLAAVLVVGTVTLLISTATGQYDQALRSQDGRAATAALVGRNQSQATRMSQQTATARPLQTANARIYATATVQAAPGATASAADVQSTAAAQVMASQLTRITSGTPALNDPLSTNSQNNVWDEGYQDNNNTGCNFVNNGYQVLEAFRGFLRPCFENATEFSNFTYQATMTFNTNCAGGLLLRGSKTTGKYALFLLDASGHYQFEMYNGRKFSLLASGTNSAILAGVGQTNTLTIIANRGVFDLFANQAFLTEVLSEQAGSGLIGVAAANINLPASVSFTNAEVWKI